MSIQQASLSSREMEAGGGDDGMNGMLSHSHSQVSMDELQHQNGHQQQFHESRNNSHHHHQNQDDFLEQMLSTIPNCSWPPNPNSKAGGGGGGCGDSTSDDNDAFHYPFDDSSSSSLALKLRQQMNGAAKSLLLQQQLLLSRGVRGGDSFLPLPLSLASAADSVDPSHTDVVHPSPFKSPAPQGSGGDVSVQALFNGFPESLHGNDHQQHHHRFHRPPPPPPQGGAMPSQNYGSQPPLMNPPQPQPQAQAQVPPASASTGGSSGAAPQRQRVRARRGQATDPHSIAERLRRERIAERMKALQELVPNANKTDKASMLDEIIDYVKFLQLQVKVLSMSRLGGAAAVAPLVADMSSEGGGGGGGVGGRSNNNINNQTGQTASTNDTMTVTEHQVAKLMEEDMGSAMQYLQGKGLCLMPISLATAISTATCHSRPPTRPRSHINDVSNVTGEVAVAVAPPPNPSSPNISALTVQTHDPSPADTNT